MNIFKAHIAFNLTKINPIQIFYFHLTLKQKKQTFTWDTLLWLACIVKLTFMTIQFVTNSQENILVYKGLISFLLSVYFRYSLSNYVYSKFLRYSYIMHAFDYPSILSENVHRNGGIVAKNTL